MSGNKGGVFVTGTGTGVGKTITAAWLVHHWRAAYWKPIQAGLDDGGDQASIQTLAPGNRIIPPAYALNTPASPHLAARLDGVQIDVASFRLPDAGDTPLVVEGAGGVLVPLNATELMADLILYLGLPALVVARSELGTINHTLLTVEALTRRNIPVMGIVMNGPANPENRAAIEHWAMVPVLAELPPLSSVDATAIAALPPPPFGPTLIE